jgi:hypothetical protein
MRFRGFAIAKQRAHIARAREGFAQGRAHGWVIVYQDDTFVRDH